MGRNEELGHQVSNVLICGRTGLLDEKIIRHISQFYKILVVGEDINPAVSASKKAHLFKEKTSSEKFSKLCYSFSPDAVWYISGYADGGEGFDDEPKLIESLLKTCDLCDVKKLIVVSSVNALDCNYRRNSILAKEHQYGSEKALRCSQSEEHLRYLAGMYSINLVLLRAPYIYMDDNENNYIGSVFRSIKEGKKIKFEYTEDQIIDFISIKNLVDLMVAVSEESFEKSEEYTLFSGYKYSYSDFESALKAINPDSKVEYQDRYSYLNVEMLELAGNSLRKNYGFVFTDNLFENLTRCYRNFKEVKRQRFAVLKKIGNFFTRKSKTIYKYLELVVFFAIIQWLLPMASESIYFRFVDLRLFFIVIMAMVHGTNIGLIAGILECISLFFAYKELNVTGTMLFYNMDYWLPFIIYLLSGSIIGYVKNTAEQKAAYVEEENKVIKEKYIFLNNVYQQVVDNKSEYKRQIMGYKDSFGKIFEAVEQLNGSVLTDIFMNGVEVLERILENHSIAIYTVDEYQKYARLVACSREMNSKLAKSMVIDEHRAVYDVVSKFETWKNTDLIENDPMYAYGIMNGSKLQILITVYETDTSQLGLYYLNLFSILCSLIRVSFKRAYEYQIAIEDEKYYPGTIICKTQYFEESLSIQQKMKDVEMASYSLLKFKSADMSYISEAINGIIRNNDIVGSREDGMFYLILTQVSDKSLDIVGKRLTEKGLEYTVVGA